METRLKSISIEEYLERLEWITGHLKELHKSEDWFLTELDDLLNTHIGNTRQFEKFIPDSYTRYWYIDNDGTIYVATWLDRNVDKGRISIGNVFRTKEDAELELSKLKDRNSIAREDLIQSETDNEFENVLSYYPHCVVGD